MAEIAALDVVRTIARIKSPKFQSTPLMVHFAFGTGRPQMDTISRISRLAPGTQEVLNDLLVERGLAEWQVVRDVCISTETVDIIYGYALTASLQEERTDQKRKRKTGAQTDDKEQPSWNCFIVLPAVSSSSTLSIKRLLSLQQCADANEPSGVSTATKRTFLCITDAANISYYALHAPAILP